MLSGQENSLKELLKHNIQIRWHRCGLLGARVAEPITLFHPRCQADSEQKQQGDRPPLQLLAEGYISLRTWKYKNYCTKTRSSIVRRVPSRRARWRHLVIFSFKWYIFSIRKCDSRISPRKTIYSTVTNAFNELQIWEKTISFSPASQNILYVADDVFTKRKRIIYG